MALRHRNPLSWIGVPQPALLLADAAIVAWLWYATVRFIANAAIGWLTLALAVVLGAACAWGGGLHRSCHITRMVAVFLLLLVAFAFVPASPPDGLQVVWLAAAATILLVLARVVAAAGRQPEQRMSAEMMRLLAIGATSTALMIPFYGAAGIGSGDAYWYSIMLADVVQQFRAGEFPVWVGQSEYAFNGTVYPLRVAPAFQYVGGLLDLLTGQSLGPTALKNLVVVVMALAGAYSAYGFLRPIVPARPTLAATLAVLWVMSPGVLAPVMRGDQYMSFMTLGFVPMVAHGCWRVWARDDTWARVWLAVGLAGAMCSHAPIALWLMLLSGGIYLGALLRRRQWRRELGWLPLLAALFLLAGSFPILSALTLDNQLKIPSSGTSVLPEIATAFPGNFLPLDRDAHGLTTYQLGYTLLGLYVLALALAGRARGAAGRWPLLVAALLMAPLTLPVPVVTDWLWLRVIPTWFITVNNVWPMQRLFLIWTGVIVFGFAAVMQAPSLHRSRPLLVALAVPLGLGLFWSWQQAQELARMLRRTAASYVETRRMENTGNHLLTRYSYASFADIPSYASHSYMEPWFENRLLERDSFELLLTNADAAAPRLDVERPGVGHPRLVDHGVLWATSDNETPFHNLTPIPPFVRDEVYALRLEATDPNTRGHLQIMHPSLFREYTLPDAGAGFRHRGPPRAFGTLPTSSKVIPLRFTGTSEPRPEVFRVITPRKETEEFSFARYWLYTYSREELPIVIESWIPYRARVETAQPAYLETPRLWLDGWRATNRGRAVEAMRSPNSLVMVPVEPGMNVIELRYEPGTLLRLSFWIGLLTWLTLMAWGGASLVRAARRHERRVTAPPPAGRPA